MGVRKRWHEPHSADQLEGWRSMAYELEAGGWPADRVRVEQRRHQARLHGCCTWRHSGARAGIGQRDEPCRFFLVVSQRQLDRVLDHEWRLEDPGDWWHTR